MSSRRFIAIAAVLVIVGFVAGLLVCHYANLCKAPSKKPPEPGLSLVGSVYSNKYHYPQCRWALRIKRENEIWFSSPEEAKRKGYVPCRECRPPDP